jgi:chromate transport protein ChrA
MESVSHEPPARAALFTHGVRAAAIGILANSVLCLACPALTQPRSWFPNVAFAVFTVHLMCWIFGDFLKRPRLIFANTLGFAIALAIPLSYLSRVS